MNNDCPCCAPPWSARFPLGCTHRKLETDLSVPPYNDWTWDHNPQGTTTGVVAILTDPTDDSVYTCGRYSLTDGATVRKQDSKGTLIWSLTDIVNSTSNCLAIDSTGYIASGSSQITLSEHYIYVRSAAGSTVWSREGQNASLTGALAMCFDASDNLLVGQSGGVGRIEKFDQTGTYVWEYGSATFMNAARGLDSDSNSNIYAAVSDSGGLCFIKLNSSGTLQWSFTHTTVDTVSCVSVSHNDAKILCGGGVSDIDGKTLRCLDASGASLWSLALYGDGTANDRVVSVSWDPTDTYCYAIQRSGAYHKITAAGAVIWTARHGAIGWGVHVSEAGRLHVSGNLTTKVSA